MFFDNNQQIGFIRATQKSEFKGFVSFSEYKQSITLFSKQYNYNIFDFMSKLFTISTNTGSSKFNVYILISTSSVIADFLSKNPDQTKYHLDINDNEHVLEKFEKLYQGEFVIFEEDDLLVCHKITKLLNIVNCPNFLKPESLKSQQDFRFNNNYNRNNNNCLGSEIDNILLKSYLKSESSREFKIITNKKEYKCSVFGVYSSSIIRKLLLQDPTIKSYVYNYEDECDEFQNICDLFNFQTVNLTRNNMDSIRRIAEDLQINLIIKDIDNYINRSEKVSQQIDEQQAIIDSIDEIFNLLYNIKEKTVEIVKQSLIESKWSKSTDNVKELAAFIIQVIEADFQLHEYIIDLLIQLDQVEENESLKILMKFIIKKLTKFAFPKKYQNESSNSSINEEKCPITVYGFIYKLYKKNIISKEKLYHKLSLTSFYIPNLKIWFYPELKEINPNFMNEPSELVDENEDSEIFDEIIQNVFEKNIDEYKKMRDDYQPLDKIAIALRKDDVKTVQSILSKTDSFKPIKFTIPFNILENYVKNGSTNYINYAAAYGSVKCFKFLFLNYYKPDKKTFRYAIYGGNSEIIKIVDQYEKNNYKNNQIGSKQIYPAILKHRNDIFDWVFEQNLINKPPDCNDFNILFNCSVECGNLHSLIELIDKGFNFTKIDIIENIFIQSCQNGFYSILLLIFNFKNDYILDLDRFDPLCLISFDNVSIFKLLENKMSPNVLEKFLFRAVEMSCTSIIKYYFESIFNRLLRLTPCCASELLGLSVSKKKNDLFYYILNNIKNIDPEILSDNFDFDHTLTLACKYGKIEIAKTITDLIAEKSGPEIDFTSFFIHSASSDSIDICKYFIDKKLKINFEAIADHVPDLGWMNEKIFDIIIKNVSLESKGKIINCINIAIRKKNKNLLNYLLKETILPYNSLFLAVQTSDVEIVDIILKVNSKPSFINQIGNNGTALSIAAKNGDIEIVKKLLSIKGIDPNLYSVDNITPLIAAFNEYHYDVINLIIDFYGNDKENLKWQFNIVINNIIDLKKKPTLNYGNQQEALEEINAKKINKNLFLCRILDTMSIDPNYHFERNNLLAYACINNSIELVQKLLKYENIDVNMYDPNLGETPLMIAIKNNNIEIIDLLINHPKIDINKRSYDNKSALIYAVSCNSKKITCHILKNEKFDPIESRLDYAFYISSEEVSEQLISVKSLDVNYCYQTLDDKPVKICNSMNDDLIQSKLKEKSYSKVKAKIKKTANKYLKKGEFGLKDDELIIGSDHKTKTSLINAFYQNDINKIKLIINHPSFDKIKSQLKTAIILSVKTGNAEVFKILSKLDDESPNIIDTSNNSLLYNSISNGYTEIYEEILKNPKFDSKKSDILKCFVMSYTLSANINNDNEKAASPILIMNQLVDYDKKNDHLIDFKKLLPCGKSFFTYGLTPSRYGEKICNFLLENGCDPNEPDKDGIYPLQYTICEDLDGYIRSLISSEKINLTKLIPCKSSLFYKFDKTSNYPNRNMPKNTTYLHLAAGISNYDIFKLFLKTDGIDVNIKDDFGETPLMIACRCQNVEVINLLEKIDNIDYLHCNNNGDDAAKIIGNVNTAQIKEKADYFHSIISIIKDKNVKNPTKYKRPFSSLFNRNHVATTSGITVGKPAPKNKSGLSLGNSIKIANKKNIFSFDKTKAKTETTPLKAEFSKASTLNKKTAANPTMKLSSGNKNSHPGKVFNILDANDNSNKQKSETSQIKSSSVNQKSHYGKFSFDFKKINDKDVSNKQIDNNNLKDNSSIVSKFPNKPESNNDDKPKFSQNSVCGNLQKEVEEATTPIFKDADGKQVGCMPSLFSKITSQKNSKNKSMLLNQDYIDRYNEIDEDEYYDSLYYQRFPSFNQNLLMMQQQQQQWFNMIQMNNERQAQINLQMMYQNQMMLQKSKKKKKKSHK